MSRSRTPLDKDHPRTQVEVLEDLRFFASYSRFDRLPPQQFASYFQSLYNTVGGWTVFPPDDGKVGDVFPSTDEVTATDVSNYLKNQFAAAKRKPERSLRILAEVSRDLDNFVHENFDSEDDASEDRPGTRPKPSHPRAPISRGQSPAPPRAQQEPTPDDDTPVPSVVRTAPTFQDEPLQPRTGLFDPPLAKGPKVRKPRTPQEPTEGLIDPVAYTRDPSTEPGRGHQPQSAWDGLDDDEKGEFAQQEAVRRTQERLAHVGEFERDQRWDAEIEDVQAGLTEEDLQRAFDKGKWGS